jgi:hypothetical protein
MDFKYFIVLDEVYKNLVNRWVHLVELLLFIGLIFEDLFIHVDTNVEEELEQ